MHYVTNLFSLYFVAVFVYCFVENYKTSGRLTIKMKSGAIIGMVLSVSYSAYHYFGQ